MRKDKIDRTEQNKMSKLTNSFMEGIRMDYKKLEIATNLGDLTAKATLQKRFEKLEKLPIRDALGYSLTWCPEDISQEKMVTIDTMYKMLKIIENNVEVKIEEESFHSCQIEGANTTLEETFDIFRARRTMTKGEQMVLNTYRAVKYLNISQKRNQETLKNLWQVVTDGVCDNEHMATIDGFRTGNVRVGTHDAPEIEFLPYCMKQFFEFYHMDIPMSPYVKVAILHFYFVYMHPFCDGNGRIARLLTSDYLIRSGLQNFSALTLSKTINERVEEYYEALEQSENNFHDVTPFILYFIDCVYENLHEVLEKQNRDILR